MIWCWPEGELGWTANNFGYRGQSGRFYRRNSLRHGQFATTKIVRRQLNLYCNQAYAICRILVRTRESHTVAMVASIRCGLAQVLV